MKYQVNFGTLGSRPPAAARGSGSPFRLAVLGDFSSRASKGELEIGADLAARKPLKVDIDNLDDVMQRLGNKLLLPIGRDGGSVELEIGCIDDLHPDELYGNLEVFEELSALRQQLDSASMFDRAAREVQSWADEEEQMPAQSRPKARGGVIPVDGKLSDFAQLVGRPSSLVEEETPADELIQQMVAPYIEAAADPRQEEYVAAVDKALSGTMRAVLHHPDFETVESLWRSVEFLVRRVETSHKLQIVLYDVSAEELAADLSSAESLEESGLYRLLVEQPVMDAHQGALSAIIGAYTFEQTPPHAELLGRLARLAACAKAPVITAIGTDCLKQSFEDLHPLTQDAWTSLRAMPEAAWLALAVPRFMLRMPYGAKSEPIDEFEFEEFDRKTGLKGMLWANPAFLVGLLLAESYSRNGAKMNLGSVMSVGEMPYHYYTDDDGDQIALPNTERLLNERLAAFTTSLGFLPILAIRGRPEVRLGGFQSLAAGELTGFWSAVQPEPGTTSRAAPEAEAVAEPEMAPEEEPVIEAAEEPAEADMEAEEEEGDDDLDALLADLGGDDEEPEEGDDDMDPDLAALLADL